MRVCETGPLDKYAGVWYILSGVPSLAGRPMVGSRCSERSAPEGAVGS